MASYRADSKSGPVRCAIGCMTGTSLDALDASLVSVHGVGLEMRAIHIKSITLPLGDARDSLHTLAHGQPLSAEAITHAADQFSELHARAISQLRSHADLDLVAVHGQTVFHKPPHSWQLLNPWPIARAADCPVVYDLRGADMASGGEGAPITPLADWILYRRPIGSHAVVNLGGFCNITHLPEQCAPNEAQGFDVCACNQILDSCARLALGKSYDEDGIHADRGTSSATHHESLSSILLEQAKGGRSLGTGDECATWVRTASSRLTPEDLLATAVDAIAQTIAITILERCGERVSVSLAGGSTQNTTLRNAINRHTGKDITVRVLDESLEHTLYRESIAIAVLGALCMDRVPITLANVTGRTDFPLLHGCWANAPVATDTLNT